MSSLSQRDNSYCVSVHGLSKGWQPRSALFELKKFTNVLVITLDSLAPFIFVITYIFFLPAWHYSTPSINKRSQACCGAIPLRAHFPHVCWTSESKTGFNQNAWFRCPTHTHHRSRLAFCAHFSTHCVWLRVKNNPWKCQKVWEAIALTAEAQMATMHLASTNRELIHFFAQCCHLLDTAPCLGLIHLTFTFHRWCNGPPPWLLWKKRQRGLRFFFLPWQAHSL